MTSHRTSLIVHDLAVNSSGTGDLAHAQPECWVDFSEASERGLTWHLDVHGTVGTFDSWYLTAKFQLGTMDIDGAGYSRFRWHDLQPEQVANLIAEGVGWYGGRSDSHVKVNLVPNPSGEASSTGWAADNGSGASSVSRPTGGAHRGTTHYQVAWTTAPAANSGGVKAPLFAVAATQVLSGAIWVKPSRGVVLRAGLEWQTSGASVISTSWADGVSCPAGKWTRVSVKNKVAPASAAGARVRVAIANGGQWSVGDTLGVDAANANPGADVDNYFDGSTPGAVWDGTANESTSTWTITPVTSDPTIVARSTDNLPVTVSRTIRHFGQLVRMVIAPTFVNGSADAAIRYSLNTAY